MPRLPDPVPNAGPTERTLFVSRKYPPSRGGMESAAVNLYTELRLARPTTLIKYGRSNRWLPIVVPLLTLRSVLQVVRGGVDAIILQDGVLAPVGRVLRAVTRKPVLVIIHGLEVTHPGPIFMRLMKWGMPAIDRVIAVSNNTARLVGNAYPGIPVSVAVNGVLDKFHRTESRAELSAAVAAITGDKVERVDAATVLITVGRLVERKGVAWFVSTALPRLLAKNGAEDYLYLVVGSGPEREHIAAAVEAAGAGDHVRLLGSLEPTELTAVYNRADAFVMPNIPVAGDVEGFGIVAVEAASTGTPVVAADIDGIPDAVRPGGNGSLVPARDVEAFVRAISNRMAWAPPRDAVRGFTLSTFSWTATAATVSRIVDEVVTQTTMGA